MMYVFCLVLKIYYIQLGGYLEGYSDIISSDQLIYSNVSSENNELVDVLADAVNNSPTIIFHPKPCENLKIKAILISTKGLDDKFIITIYHLKDQCFTDCLTVPPVNASIVEGAHDKYHDENIHIDSLVDRYKNITCLKHTHYKFDMSDMGLVMLRLKECSNMDSKSFLNLKKLIINIYENNHVSGDSSTIDGDYYEIK